MATYRIKTKAERKKRLTRKTPTKGRKPKNLRAGGGRTGTTRPPKGGTN